MSRLVVVWEVLCNYVLNKSRIYGVASRLTHISVVNTPAPISTLFSC